MSPSKAEVSVSVVGDQGEIEIIDGKLAVVASGVGKLDTQSLAPGIYKARVTAGHARAEQFFSVQPDTLPVNIQLPAPIFASAIPLDGTSTSHEYQQAGVAEALTRQPVNIGAGDGARLFICLRDPWTAPDVDVAKQPQYAKATFDGFRLLSETGEVFADLDSVIKRLPERRMATLDVSVTPGAYILSYDRGANAALHMPVHVVPHWQTLIFINVHPADDGVAGKPDLLGRAVVYAHAGSPFDAWSAELKLAEIARAALSDGRNAISDDDLQLLLSGKFMNPMLGIFAAHLLLRRGDGAHPLLSTVLSNLSLMLGEGFPDVAALRLELARSARSAARVGTILPLREPPLLQASWDLLRRDPASIVRESFAARVAPMLVPNGIWTAWQPLPEKSVAPTAKPRATNAVVNAVEAGLRAAFESSSAVRLPSVSSLLERLHGSAASDQGDTAADAALTLVLSLATHPETRGLLESSRTGSLRAQLMPQLTRYQKMLLPTLESIAQQTAGGEQFTLEDVRDIILRYGLPLDMAAREIGDLAAKLHNVIEASR